MNTYRTQDSETTISNLQAKVEKLEGKLKRKIEFSQTIRNIKSWWFINGPTVSFFVVVTGIIFCVAAASVHVRAANTTQCETHGQLYHSRSKRVLICADQDNNLYAYHR